MGKQETLNLPLAGTVADVRDKLAADNPNWGDRPTLTCTCCGERYRRKEWKCCAPQGGMASVNWFELWHEDCPTADAAEGTGKRKCPRHCRCERVTPSGNLPLPRANLTPADVKDLVEELKVAAESGVRSSSLPVDPKFLESEWPNEEAK